MDKNEQQDVLKTIKVMYNAENYHGILAIVRDMHLDRIKDRRVLEMIADAYELSGLYEDAREALLIAYEKFPQSRSLAYKLAVISVKLENLDDAVDFYEDFCRLSPSDNRRYILKYMIGKAGGIEVKELIKVLEQYTSRETDDKWLYELARLYHEEGRADECVEICDEITLWYAAGEYEKAALELKFTHKALSPAQQARYEEIMSAYVESEPEDEDSEEEKEEEKELEEEAESFASEFLGEEPEAAAEPKEEPEASAPLPASDSAAEESAGHEPEPSDSGEYAIPVGKIAAVIDAEAQNRPEETKIIYKRKAVKKLLPAAEAAEAVKTADKPVKEQVFEHRQPVILSETAAAKAGAAELFLSPKASLVVRPSFIKEVKRPEPEPVPEEEPQAVLPEPEPEEARPPVSINLALMDEWDEGDTIEGQITIDEFFKEYAGLVRQRKDKVAAVEAERVRQIVEAVSKMEPRPLFDLNFDTPDNEEFSEEEIIASEKKPASEPEAQTAKGQAPEDPEKTAAAKTQETAVQAAAADTANGAFRSPENSEELAQALAKAYDAAVKEKTAEKVSEDARQTEAEETAGDAQSEPAAGAAPAEAAEPEEGMQAESGAESEQTQTSEEETAQSEAAVNEEVQAEAGTQEEAQTQAAEEENIQAESVVNEEAQTESGTDEEAQSEAAAEGETAQAETAAEEVQTQAAAKQTAGGTAPDINPAGASGELSEELAEDIFAEIEKETAMAAAAVLQPEDKEVAEAIARFEESMKEETVDENDEDDLMGFGDDLADMVSKKSGSRAEPMADVTEIIRMKKFRLSETSKEEMKEFLLIPGMEAEIERACETIIEKKRMGDSTGGNLIITGDKKSGKTYLAVAVIKAVIRELGLESGKVVRVQSQPLNGKNIRAVLDNKVGGRDLIIENVGYLEDETIADLIYEMEYGDVPQMIVLEGNVLSIENIIAHFPEVKRLFASRINIEELSIAQWADIAKDYAKKQGYYIGDMATLALHAKIDKINVATSRVGLGDIKDIVDSAISKSSKHGSGKLFAAFSKKGKEETELTESDFI